MHGKLGLLSPGKARMHFFLCAVFSYFRTTGCEAYFFFTTDGYGIFNVITNLGVCRTHKWGYCTNTSAQELTRRDRKLFLTLPGQGIEPGVLGFEFRLSNH